MAREKEQLLKPLVNSILSSFCTGKLQAQQSGQKGGRSWNLPLDVSSFSKLTAILFGGTDGHLWGPAPPLFHQSPAEMGWSGRYWAGWEVDLWLFEMMELCLPLKEATMNNTTWYYMILTSGLCTCLTCAIFCHLIVIRWQLGAVIEYTWVRLQCRTSATRRFAPWVGNISWRRKWQPTPVSLPGKFHGQRSLMGCRPWGH